MGKEIKMSETEAIETLEVMVDYMGVVRDVVNSYINGEIGLKELEDMRDGLDSVLDSFGEVE